MPVVGPLPELPMSDRPNPARIVADADVLAADLVDDGAAREALDLVRAHSWVELVATDPLLDDAETVIAEAATPERANEWRAAIESLATLVEQPPGDHPALAAAYHGSAAHILSFDDSLQSAAAGASIRSRVATSVKSPAAFVAVFDPERLYPEVVGGEYPGPDRDPSEWPR